MVVIVVVIHIVVIAATPLRFLKFFAALARLSAVLAVALHRVTQLIISLVNALFTSFVSLGRPRVLGGTGPPSRSSAIQVKEF